jgi:muramidase (phage lysozyme)
MAAMPRIDADTAGGQNRIAFLDMIAVSEIGAPLLAASDDGYNVLVGSTAAKPLLFPSYADHPNVLNAQLHSTAAGRYQILYRWWRIYRAQMYLRDFSPISQDRYALQQLKEHGALPYIDAGKFETAVVKVASVWASLPGAGYGQHENQIEHLQAAYVAAGGTVTT